MNIYMHFQFTGLHKNTTPISLGLWSENGDAFYAEFIDYDKSQVTDWIQDNILADLWINNEDKLDSFSRYVIGSKEEIASEVRNFLSKYDSVQLIGDVSHYDMILFIDLFGTAFDLPKNVSHVCHDINSDIARHYNLTEAKAFDLSRKDIIGKYYGLHHKKNYNASDMAFDIWLIYEAIGGDRHES